MANANKPLDGNGLLYIWQKVLAKLTGKVDKEEGKGLSTNDYTTEEKTKLAGIDKGANKYTHPAYTAKTGVPTANQTPAFGGTFNISQPVSDVTGHITEINSRTVTIPSTAATTSAAGLMSAADKTKLDGVDTGAQVNQNAFSNVVVGSTTVAADSTTDTLTLAGGSNVTITPDATNGKITITAKNTTYSAATASANGLMSSTDKAKLDAFGAASEYAKKSDLTNVYVYKGSVATYADLPTTGLTAGNVYNVEADGMNYAWTGDSWDALGMVLEIEYLTNAEIDEIIGA